MPLTDQQIQEIRDEAKSEIGWNRYYSMDEVREIYIAALTKERTLRLEAPRWINVKDGLPELFYEVVAKFNNLDAGLGFFMYLTDWDCGEKTLIFRFSNTDNEDVRCEGLVEWLYDPSRKREGDDIRWP